MKENTIEKRLVDGVEAVGGLAIKFPPLFYAGFPDRLVLLPGGLLVLVETKAPGIRPLKLQEKVHAKLKSRGFRVEVLDTVEKVDTFLLTL